MKTATSILTMFVIFLMFLFYSCTKSGGTVNNGNEGGNEPPPTGGNGDCDTANMKYMANVVPILQSNCYKCHGSATNSSGEGIVLEGYNNVRPYAESGTLIGVITHANGYPEMPKDASKLSDCNINKIRSWINRGFQNN